MDRLTRQLHTYLVRLGLNPDAATPQEEHNLEHLLLLLAPEDEQALTGYYGLFGVRRQSLQDIAHTLGLSPEDAMERIDRCVRRLAVTPEWQMIKPKI